MAFNKFLKWAIIRSIVSALNRSEQNSTVPLKPAGNSAILNINSNLDVSFLTPIPVNSIPSILKSSAAGAFCNMNITWKTGLLDNSLFLTTASTTFSKGTSWCP